MENRSRGKIKEGTMIADNPILNRKYNRIPNKNATFDLSPISTDRPDPTDADYLRGYITRYFVQKANDSAAPILEINETEYNRLSTKSQYKTISLDWKISGSIEKITEANKKSIAYATDGMKNIRLYLPNLQQYSRK